MGLKDRDQDFDNRKRNVQGEKKWGELEGETGRI